MDKREIETLSYKAVEAYNNSVFLSQAVGKVLDVNPDADKNIITAMIYAIDAWVDEMEE